MRRREFIETLGAVVAWPLTARAQEPRRTYRLGALFPSPRSAPQMVALLEELQRSGFSEGQNLAVEWRVYGQHIESVSEFAAELVRAKVDIIIAGGNFGIRAAQQATTAIPIIGFTDDMVGAGLAASLARPGANTTGVSLLASDLDGKRQEILIEAVPGLRRMAVFADTETTSPQQLDALKEAARARDIELSIHRIAQPEDITPALDKAKTSNTAALNVLASPLLFANRRIFIERAAALRLPAIYQWPDVAEEGGLIGYGPRLTKLFRDLQARKVVKVLRGAKPSDLPIEQPTEFELVINNKTANALGLSIPPSLLARADEVIE